MPRRHSIDASHGPCRIMGSAAAALSPLSPATRSSRGESDTPSANISASSDSSTAMSSIYWVGLAILIGGLVLVCYHGSRWAWLNVAALVAALHGLPGLLEPNPRFSVAWIHTGFIDQISTNGTLLRSLDARFSWAGFFAGGGLLQRWAGTESLLWLVRYAPLFYNGISVVLVALLARRLRATEMQSVLAAAFFACLNWIGQDYFAPQATGFVLYLLIITVVLYAFPADPSLGHPWMIRLMRPGMDVQRGLQGRAGQAGSLRCVRACRGAGGLPPIDTWLPRQRHAPVDRRQRHTSASAAGVRRGRVPRLVVVRRQRVLVRSLRRTHGIGRQGQQPREPERRPPHRRVPCGRSTTRDLVENRLGAVGLGDGVTVDRQTMVPLVHSRGAGVPCWPHRSRCCCCNRTAARWRCGCATSRCRRRASSSPSSSCRRYEPRGITGC